MKLRSKANATNIFGSVESIWLSKASHLPHSNKQCRLNTILVPFRWPSVPHPDFSNENSYDYDLKQRTVAAAQHSCSTGHFHFNNILQFILRNSVYLLMSNDVYVCVCVSSPDAVRAHPWLRVCVWVYVRVCVFWAAALCWCTQLWCGGVSCWRYFQSNQLTVFSLHGLKASTLSESIIYWSRECKHIGESLFLMTDTSYYIEKERDKCSLLAS